MVVVKSQTFREVFAVTRFVWRIHEIGRTFSSLFSGFWFQENIFNSGKKVGEIIEPSMFHFIFFFWSRGTRWVLFFGLTFMFSYRSKLHMYPLSYQSQYLQVIQINTIQSSQFLEKNTFQTFSSMKLLTFSKLRRPSCFYATLNFRCIRFSVKVNICRWSKWRQFSQANLLKKRLSKHFQAWNCRPFRNCVDLHVFMPL